MKSQNSKTVALGELISAVFDKAAEYSTDPQEVSRLAVQTIERMLWRGWQATLSPCPVG